MTLKCSKSNKTFLRPNLRTLPDIFKLLQSSDGLFPFKESGDFAGILLKYLDSSPYANKLDVHVKVECPAQHLRML